MIVSQLKDEIQQKTGEWIEDTVISVQPNDFIFALKKTGFQSSYS